MYVCVSVWGVLLCVVRRLWDDLRAERCLPAQAPCLRIKAAREKLHKEVKEVLTRRHRSFPVFVFFLPIPCFVLSTSQKSLAVHYQIQTTGTCCYSDTGFLLPSISVPLQFFVPFLNTFPLSDAARLHMRVHVSNVVCASSVCKALPGS